MSEATVEEKRRRFEEFARWMEAHPGLVPWKPDNEMQAAIDADPEGRHSLCAYRPCKCSASGWIDRHCSPFVFRWVIERLVTEFGESAVRLGWPVDWGYTQKVAVSLDDWHRFGMTFTLKGDGGLTLTDVRYDVNDYPSDVEAFISAVRQRQMRAVPSP